MEPIRANFTREEIAAACLKYGPQVEPLPLGVKLLCALSASKSTQVDQ